MLETTVDGRAHRGGVRPSSSWTLPLIAALALGGCGNELASYQLPPQAQQGVKVAQTSSSQGFFASVSAIGTGCPPGSILANISPDGKAFTILFSEYDLEVSESVSFATKNCKLSFKLESATGLTFAIPAIYYSGYAYLEEGVSATQTALYTFRNSGLSIPQRGKNELVGPFDDAFVFEHGGERVWTACGTRSIVNVHTQLQMQNGGKTGIGQMTLSAVDGNTDKLTVNLDFRPCQPSTGRNPSVQPGARGVAPDAAVGDAEEGDFWITPNVKKR